MIAAAMASSSYRLPLVFWSGAGQDDQHEGGDAAAQAGEQVKVEPLAAYVDAGEPGRFRVAADGDRTAAERGPVEDQPADDGDRGEDQDQGRDAQDVRVGQAQVEDGLDGDDLGLAVGDLQGEPAGRGEHGERRDEGDHTPVGDEDPVDEPGGESDDHGREQDAREAEVLGGERRRPDGGEGHHRADRQVDAAADDDQGHADGDDSDDGGLRQDQLEVPGVQERVGFGETADGHQHGEYAEQGQVADIGAQTECAQTAGGRGWRGGAGRGPLLRPLVLRRRCGLCHDVGLPSMTRSSTRCSSSSWAAAVCTTRPSRSTSTRSARPSTSGTSLETSSTARPSSASRRITA